MDPSITFHTAESSNFTLAHKFHPRICFPFSSIFQLPVTFVRIFMPTVDTHDVWNKAINIPSNLIAWKLRYRFDMCMFNVFRRVKRILEYFEYKKRWLYLPSSLHRNHASFASRSHYVHRSWQPQVDVE